MPPNDLEVKTKNRNNYGLLVIILATISQQIAELENNHDGEWYLHCIEKEQEYQRST